MAFPTYAKLLHEPYRVQREPAVLRTDMESGPPKQAKLKSRVMVTRELAYAFGSITDYTNFLTWFKTDINRGASWFDWTDPVDGVVKQARIVAGTLDEERPNRQMDVWVISFKIETWDS
jgi:hypothetical protein